MTESELLTSYVTFVEPGRAAGHTANIVSNEDDVEEQLHVASWRPVGRVGASVAPQWGFLAAASDGGVDGGSLHDAISITLSCKTVVL